MPRATNGPSRKNKRKKIHKITKGFRGRPGKLYRSAKDAARRALVYAYRDRRQRKRFFRRIWIQRISAGCRANGLRYSEFIALLGQRDIHLNRKALADMLTTDPSQFSELVKKVQE